MAAYNKTDLIKELSEISGVTRREIRVVLDSLAEIACREAKDGGFTVPGICRLDRIRKKARRVRNPQTGQFLLISEHDAARVRLLKRAKDQISPPHKRLVTPLLEDGETPAPEQEEEEQVQEEVSVVPREIIYDDFSVAISFKCKSCGGEIEAPAAAVGLTSECPVCGKHVVIPQESEPGTIHGPKIKQPTAEEIAEAKTVEAIAQAEAAPQMSKTIRIDLSTLEVTPQHAPKPKQRIVSFFCKSCNQELEAPAEMMGMGTECPSCGNSLEVPFFSDAGTHGGSDLDKKDGAHSARTIRIEMPDF
ncbi:MAG: HU family DNA-binding protein [Kiritimatiellia bacterium]|jgi:DNA-binding protein HU-beta